MVASVNWFEEKRRKMNQTGNDILLSHEALPKETKRKNGERVIPLMDTRTENGGERVKL